MAEQAKAASTPATQEQAYPASTIVQYPHQAYNGASFPPPGPPGYMPPFFTYPPPPDGAHPEGQNGTVSAPPYMMALPPGVVYAYPPPQAPGFTSPPPGTAPVALTRPKRKQVKMACTNCASACKRCDENRPCERCLKYGTPDTCVDGVRKERKKGVKRGPYKRKNKDQMDSGSQNGDFTPGTATSTSTTAAAIHAAAPYVPEGYYPLYYPPPGAFMPHVADGQPGDGSPPHANGQPPMIPYVIHPGVYPPFPHYPPMYPHQAAPPSAPAPQPGAHPPVPAISATPTQPPGVVVAVAGQPTPPPQVEEPQQITTVNPADTARKPDERAGMNVPVVDPALNGKKRTRTTKSGEPKSKKLKTNGAAGRTEEKGGDMGVEPSAIMNGGGEGGHGA